MYVWVFGRIMWSTGQRIPWKESYGPFWQYADSQHRGVQEYLANVGFKRRRMEHLPDTTDLRPCDFFLFEAIKESFSPHCFNHFDDFFCCHQEPPECPFWRFPTNDFWGIDTAIAYMLWKWERMHWMNTTKWYIYSSDNFGRWGESGSMSNALCMSEKAEFHDIRMKWHCQRKVEWQAKVLPKRIRMITFYQTIHECVLVFDFMNSDPNPDANYCTDIRITIADMFSLLWHHRFPFVSIKKLVFLMDL